MGGLEETGSTLTRETDQLSAIILLHLKYLRRGPENKSTLSAVLKPFYLRFAFWKKKSRLYHQYICPMRYGFWPWKNFELILTWKRLCVIKEGKIPNPGETRGFNQKATHFSVRPPCVGLSLHETLDMSAGAQAASSGPAPAPAVLGKPGPGLYLLATGSPSLLIIPPIVNRL